MLLDASYSNISILHPHHTGPIRPSPNNLLILLIITASLLAWVTGRHSQGAHLSGVATLRDGQSQGAYSNIRCCSAGVYTGDAVRLKYILAMLFC